MVKVVIDTNVLISGLLKTSVTCRRIIHKLSNKEFSFKRAALKEEVS